MRSISTLFLLFIVSCCFGQMVDTSQVVVIGNCWGRVKADTIKKIQGIVSAAKVRGLNVQSVSKGVLGGRMVCHGVRTIFPSDTLPLLLVDGDVKKYDSLKLINQDAIQEITVLKPAAGVAIFGPDGVNGAICITTKKSSLQTFTIKDFTDGSSIPGATVSFISNNRKDTVFFVANDSGSIATNKLQTGAGYSISVSSIGYKTNQQDFINTTKQYQKEILLTKDIKQSPEVVITAIQCWTRCRRPGRGKVIPEKQTITPKPVLDNYLFKVYPNPVSKSTVPTIQWNNVEEAVVEVRMVSLDGRTMLRQPVTNKGTAGQLQLSADSRWAAGIYFLQIICEKGKVLASEKIIIQ